MPDKGGDGVDGAPWSFRFAARAVAAQVVSGIRRIGDPLPGRQSVPVEVERIGAPVGIVRAAHDELRHRELVAVEERVHPAPQPLRVFCVRHGHEAARRVVADTVADTPEHLHLMRQLLAHVERVDHHGRDGFDARVGGGRQPRGPAPLRGAADDEALQVLAPLAAEAFLERVHGLHEALGHGKEERPRRVLCFQIADEGFGDERVLHLAAEERLTRDAEQEGDRGLDPRGEHGAVGIVPFLRRAAAVHEEQLPAGGHIQRPEDDEVMLPALALPFLRGQLQQPDVAAVRRGARGLRPAIGRLGTRHVGFQIGTRRHRGGGEEQKERQFHGERRAAVAGPLDAPLHNPPPPVCHLLPVPPPEKDCARAGYSPDPGTAFLQQPPIVCQAQPW